MISAVLANHSVLRRVVVCGFPLKFLSICGSRTLVELCRFFNFLIYTQSVGLLERGISPSQDRYLHTEQQTE
jgi:hypothetical protein